MNQPASSPGGASRLDPVTQLLLWCGIIGGPLFVVVLVAEGQKRDGYDPIRQPVSSLTLARRGWVQQTNFVATGLLMLAASRGLRRARPGSRWVPRLLTAYAIGLVGSGVVVTDPLPGYRPDPPEADGSAPHVLHDLFGLIVFGTLAGAALIEARASLRAGRPVWAMYSGTTGILVTSGIGLFGRGFAQATEVGTTTGLAKVAGLVQRATIAVGWGWLSLLAMREFRGRTPRR